MDRTLSNADLNGVSVGIPEGDVGQQVCHQL